ncbi:MAG: hypothetical protein LUF04_15985, partial [Bacteroides sp.]|nr:hypothetical protein [Bacteroides sp.]
SMIAKVAKVLECDVKFIKEFVLENAMRNWNLHDNEFTNNSTENSHDNVLQGGIDIETQTNTYNTYPIDDVKELYKQLLEEKDKQINRFEKEVTELKARLQEIEKGIK